MDRYDLYAFIISLTTAFVLGVLLDGPLGFGLIVGLATYIGIIWMKYL